MRLLRIWLMPIFVITLLCGLVYGAVQQSYRQSANDPQIQLVEDWATSLATGASSSPIEEGAKIEISDSLSPFLMAFDASGKVAASSALLHGQTPSLPNGVLASAKTAGETRITWQPEANVRSAIVIKYYKSGAGEGYMLAGRSLREVEARENQLMQIVFAGWGAGMLGSLIMAWIIKSLKK